MWWRSEVDGLVSKEKPELLSLVENSKEVKEKEGVEKNKKRVKEGINTLSQTKLFGV